jgi:ribonuclease HI
MSSIIYTDGSCAVKTTKKGGWAFVTFEDSKEWCVKGGERNTTNNRMELAAVIEALRFTHHTNLTIYSDSLLTINCASGLWKRKKNKDLWDEYDKQSKEKKINYLWVKAHNGDKYNEIVDKLAKSESLEK